MTGWVGGSAGAIIIGTLVGAPVHPEGQTIKKAGHARTHHDVGAERVRQRLRELLH
eukprot:SAG22_NODE_9026_length_614_cov_0.867961_2_plen_55_part_01